MDSRERVRLALTCRQPDRVPAALGFFRQSLPGTAPVDADEYFGSDVRFLSFEEPPAQASFLEYLRGLPEDIYVGDLDQLRTYDRWNYHPELGPHGPLAGARKLEDLAGFTPPNTVDERQIPALRHRVDDWHRQGLAVAGGAPHLGGELFETAARMRGYGTFLVDLLEHRELVHYLLDQLTAVLMQSVNILARAGVDTLMLDDDVAMPTGLIIGLEAWREFLGPRLSRVIQAALDVSPDMLVCYHSDGDFTRLLPDLIEIGVHAINPLQPDCMDAAAIKRDYGDRLAMWGTVGTASQWDNGTPDEIRGEVRERIATLGVGGGLLLCPAYDLVFAPLENITAFAEAAKGQG